ncbi:AraC family transcriptional regulator [Salinisphaera sp. SPP-AMP-43]|uniref:AraC family transcriptional regulator n=1 Tax=Salinisphaera sp. SPP-AMP-43 TaxID=3121288 RepID=UPI003C6DF569
MSIGAIRPNRRSAMMRVDSVQTLIPVCLRESHLSITRVRVGYAGHGPTKAFELEEAYILSIQLTGCAYTYSQVGQPAVRLAWPERTVAILNLRIPWQMDMHSSFDMLHFHITQAALNDVADQLDMPPVRGLSCHPAAGRLDSVLYGLALALVPSVERPHQESRLFVDSVRFIVGAHVARQYSGIEMARASKRVGLAPWQARRAQEMIDASLAGDVTIEQLARECGISPGHFLRGFRKTTGTTPHQWLIRRRIDRAQVMLSTTTRPISEIAANCGFADQSHLTRVFSRYVGISPAAWRRQGRAESF